MIISKEDYINYLEKDRVALGRKKMGGLGILFNLVSPDYIWDFQRLLRKLEYYKNNKRNDLFGNITYFYLKLKYKKLSLKLGFTIPTNVFGPGLAIVHYGTIVVNENAQIGANCRIHVGANIGASGGSDRAPLVGDNVYIGPGVKIVGDVKVPNNTVIAANSVVTKTFSEENMMLAGIPAKCIKPIAVRKIIKHI